MALRSKFIQDPILFAKFEICTDSVDNDNNIIAYASMKRGKRWLKFDESLLESWILKILCGERNWIVDEEFPLLKKLAHHYDYTACTEATTNQREVGADEG